MTTKSDWLEDGTVLRIVVDRPAGNVLNIALFRELSDLIRAGRASPHVRMILLEGSGGNFSFGADIEEHRKERVGELLAEFHRLVRETISSPVPVAVFVQGICFGGALEIALCCHFVFAHPTAQFGCPEIKLGVFAPVLAAIGHLRLGGPTAERLLLTGSTLTAAEADKTGWLAGIVGGEEEVLVWYRSRLRPLSAFSLREATLAGRAALTQASAAGLTEIERRYLDRLLPSHDGNEGIEAFLAHRPPEWEDR